MTKLNISNRWKTSGYILRLFVIFTLMFLVSVTVKAESFCSSVEIEKNIVAHERLLPVKAIKTEKIMSLQKKDVQPSNERDSILIVIFKFMQNGKDISSDDIGWIVSDKKSKEFKPFGLGFVDVLSQQQKEKLKKFVTENNLDTNVEENSYTFILLGSSFAGKITPRGGDEMIIAQYYIVPQEMDEFTIAGPEKTVCNLAIESNWIPDFENRVTDINTYQGTVIRTDLLANAEWCVGAYCN